MLRALHQHALEPLLPQRTAAALPGVVVLGESLFEGLEELGDVVHAVGEPALEAFGRRVLALAAVILKLPGDQFHFLTGLDMTQTAKQFLVGQFLTLGHVEGDVEVVGHETVGEDIESAESGEVSHEGQEFLLLPLAEDHAPFDDAGHGVVVAGAVCLDSGSAHHDLLYLWEDWRAAVFRRNPPFSFVASWPGHPAPTPRASTPLQKRGIDFSEKSCEIPSVPDGL
jgi:hypothetical protein